MFFLRYSGDAQAFWRNIYAIQSFFSLKKLSKCIIKWLSNYIFPSEKIKWNMKLHKVNATVTKLNNSTK